MANLDLKKRTIKPSDPRHSRHADYRKAVSQRATGRVVRRSILTSVFFVISIFFAGEIFMRSETAYGSRIQADTSEFQNVRIQALARGNQLPVTAQDPKTEIVRQYLAQRNSPLAEYAGLISRLPNWRLLLGIANAESGLCKKTDKNNCWGIGPGSPFTYDDISESLYHANYLLTRFESMGMKRPETLVNTYVGYYNPNWIAAINEVFYDLKQVGLQ